MILPAEHAAIVGCQPDVDDHVFLPGVFVDGDASEERESVAGVDVLGCAAQDGVEAGEGECGCFQVGKGDV